MLVNYKLKYSFKMCEFTLLEIFRILKMAYCKREKEEEDDI